MKKQIKRLVLTALTVLALFGAGTGVAFASGYITWGGTEDYQETLTILEQIERRSNELGVERSQLINELTNSASVIEQQETTIAELNAHIDKLEQEGAATDQSKIEQAEQDMNHVKERSQEVLENLSDSFSR